MVYRKDLEGHFDWLAGSEYFDEVIDEALVAVALTAYDHGRDWIQHGAWMNAKGVVERLLEEFVDRLRGERLL